MSSDSESTEMNFRYLATDGVVLVDLSPGATNRDESGVVLLKRNHPPFEGYWVLPGGMVERDETAHEACEREVAEEVGLEVEARELIGLYDDPERDERGNVSAAYLCLPEGEEEPRPLEEADEVRVFDLDELPEMGFDHREIVGDALEVWRRERRTVTKRNQEETSQEVGNEGDG